MIIVIFTERFCRADPQQQFQKRRARAGSANKRQAEWETCLKGQGKHMEAVKLNGAWVFTSGGGNCELDPGYF